MPQSVARERLELSDRAVEHLHLLMAESQILADLGMGDVMITVPVALAPGPRPQPAVGTAMRVVSHTRPATAQTMYVDDQPNREVDDDLAEFLREAWGRETLTVKRDNVTHRQVMAVPVTCDSHTLGVLSLHTDGPEDGLSRMDLFYRDSALDLMRMARVGAWPTPGHPTAPGRGAPRVGDGVIRLDARDRVSFMSPNAVSAVNRLGSSPKVMGEFLTDVLASVLPKGQQVDEVHMGVLRGRMANYAELRRGRAAVMFRSIPLKFDDDRLGAILLCRDVSELRRRERELDSKDATIRETHHRVKNSLQTVSAMLRMQTRRAESEEARRGLAQATGRVDTVAMVHDALSQMSEEAVDFDAYFSRQLRTIVDLAATEGAVEPVLEGSFGELPGRIVTPLALVLNEIVTNAVEHGLGGRGGMVKVTAQRRRPESTEPDPSTGGVGSGAEPSEELVVTVSDDGAGLPADFPVGRWAADEKTEPRLKPRGLGSRIVRNLVLGELDGAITWGHRQGGGTTVETIVPLYTDSR